MTRQGAPPEHDHIIGQALDLRHVVRGQEDGRSRALLVTLQIAANPVRRIGIERGSRLIQQQHVRLVDQRLCQSQPGLLTGGQGAGGPMHQLAKIEFACKDLQAFTDASQAVEMSVDDEVLPDGQSMRQVDIGRGKIQARQDGRPLVRHVPPKHHDAAFTRRNQTQNHTHGRRFAGALAPQQCRHGARLDGKAQMVDCSDIVEALAQPGDLDGGAWHARSEMCGQGDGRDRIGATMAAPIRGAINRRWRRS